MVLSIQTKKIGPDRWEAYTDNGRERTGLDALEWAGRGVELGAGELLVTSVDREGTQKGMDLEFLRKVTARVDVPVIAGGGAGTPEHACRAITEAGADAVAVASMLHYGKYTVGEIKARLAQADVPVRSSA
jgi:cyclase